MNGKTHKPILILALVLITFINSFGQEKDVDNKLWEKALEIHSNAVVCDAHAHQLVFNKDDQIEYYPNSQQLEFEMVKNGGIDAIGLYFAYYPLKDETLFARIKSDFKTFHKRINNHTDQYIIISDTSDIQLGINHNKLMIIPGVEYFYGALNGKVSTIDSLYNLGIRSLMLMDNGYERLSYENGNINGDRNLNILAERSIEKMNDLGILIDITHLDDQMQEKIIDYSDYPVIASHSSTRGVHNIERNVPDYIIKKLIKKGGSIMITFNSGNLTGLEKGRCKIEPLIDHIDHAVKVAGIDHVGIGSDFNGAGLRSPKGLEDASGFPLITYHLLKRGYAEDEIKKIMGGNYLRVLSEVMNLEKESFIEKMVHVEGGNFLMGDSWKIGADADNENPAHEVQLNSFYISKYEITQKQYKKVMKRNPSVWKGENLPVDFVTWYDAILFCNRLSNIEGLKTCYTIDGTHVVFNQNANGYRLPTEAEWEYAARDKGRNDRKWSGTNSHEQLKDYAWYWRNCGEKFLIEPYSDKLLLANNFHPHPVGSKKPNELGIYDMSGNVLEWCWDWYDQNYYTYCSTDNPLGPEEGTLRVLRGGQYTRTADHCRSTKRFSFNPVKGYGVIGFRVAKNANH